MEKISKITSLLIKETPADAVAVGVINFKKSSFEAFEMTRDGDKLSHGFHYYDLASLTKVLTNSLSYFLEPKSFDESMLLCLSHRGGLPAWGLLPRTGWKEQILSYPIKASETLYSDFSALRVMLELEKKGKFQKEICQKIWDKEMVFWLDLPDDVPLLQFGLESTLPNLGLVHDPNARLVREFCSHAGLFGTIQGVCRTLLNYHKETDFLNLVKADLKTHSHRFSYGWDRVENPETSLAGKGAGPFSFGHLGFTGTSIWIDPDKGVGHVILTNTTKFHWFDKAGLADIRRAIGEEVWAEN